MKAADVALWQKADRLGVKLLTALRAIGYKGDAATHFRLAVRDGVIEVTRRSEGCRKLQVDAEYEGTPVRVSP